MKPCETLCEVENDDLAPNRHSVSSKTTTLPTLAISLNIKNYVVCHLLLSSYRTLCILFCLPCVAQQEIRMIIQLDARPRQRLCSDSIHLE